MQPSRPDSRVAWLVAVLCAALIAVAWSTAPQAAGPQGHLLSNVKAAPSPAAEQYRAAMTRSAYRIHGPAAPIATLAGQIHQESAWQPLARSPVGAEGLAQFMPATAADMAARFAADCAPANPFSPAWAFACRDRYMQTLLRQVRSQGPGLTECSRWVFALRAYNGGMGWVLWDRAEARRNGVNPDDWAQVQPYRGTNPRTGARRSDANHRENTEYPARILWLQARYAAWGPRVC